MTTKPKTQKVPLVWAIDPFEKETTPSASLVIDLEKWVTLEGFVLQPVYVHSVPKSDLPKQGLWITRHNLAIRRSIEQYLRDLGVKTTLLPQVLMEHSTSRKNAVQRIITYAEEIDSPMILISTHGRSGAERWVFGSFAENLLAHSQRPVIFLTHGDTAFSQGFNRVLFSTDFSDRSKEAFQDFLKHAKALGAEVILYHAMSLPPFVDSGSAASGVVTATPPNYFRDHEVWLKQEGQKEVEEAKKVGVAARFVMNDISLGSDFASAILTTAKKEHVGMIAMASISGPFISVIFGSIAKEVFRSNRYPVWVYGPKATVFTSTADKSLSSAI